MVFKFYGLLQSFAGSYGIYQVDCGLLWLFVGFLGLPGYMGTYIIYILLTTCVIDSLYNRHTQWYYDSILYICIFTYILMLTFILFI